jgi:hypothetical protein
MKRVIALLYLLLAAAPVLAAHSPLNITLTHDNAAEMQTKAQLERLIATYDFAPWLFTKSVVINSEAIPHSHPVLTLHTRHLKDDDLLVSTFVHEQLHWFLADRSEDVDAAIEELRQLYPSIPVGYPQGSSDERGNYVHLIVVLLEYRANRQLLGELRARQTMDFWAADHYTWIYRAVLDHGADISKVLKQHDLFPKAAPNNSFKPTPLGGAA